MKKPSGHVRNRRRDDMARLLWLGVCVGTTINWESMLQQNFEATERAGRKFAKVSEAEMREKTILYRLASWPNLTQLLFLASPLPL